jgi:hypothetical protein
VTEDHYFVPFLAWLSDQQHRDDPIGDLARDTARDDEAEPFDDAAAFVQYMGKYPIAAQEAAIKAAAEYMAWDQGAHL